MITEADAKRIEEQLWKMTSTGDQCGKMYRDFRLMRRINPGWPTEILKLLERYEKVLAMVLVQQDTLEVEMAQELAKAQFERERKG